MNSNHAVVGVGGAVLPGPHRNGPMTESPSLWRRPWRALGRAIKRVILSKSSHDYMKQFTGSDEYWDNIIAAQRGRDRRKPDGT
jgi:hypothetical protein